MPNPSKNTKEQLHRTNAAIWLNKVCRSNHPTANCIKITEQRLHINNTT